MYLLREEGMERDGNDDDDDGDADVDVDVVGVSVVSDGCCMLGIVAF